MAQYWNSLKRLSFILSEIFLAQYSINLGILLILQLLDVEVKITNNEDDSSKNIPIRRHPGIHQFLLQSTPFKPDMRITNVIIYSTILSSIILFHYRRYFWPSCYDMSKEFLYSYLLNPKEGELMIEKSMNKAIRDLIVSNSNYTCQLIKDEILKNTHNLNSSNNTSEIENLFQHYSKIFDDDTIIKTMTLFNISSDTRNQSHGSSNLNRISDCNIMTRIQQHLHVLRAEYCYLDSLLNDKSSIWPKNRNEKYIKFLKRLWFILQSNVVGSLTSSVHFMSFTVLYYNHKRTPKEHISSSSRAYISWFRVQYHFAFYILMEEYLYPSIQLTVSLFDLIQLIHSFRNQVEEFRKQAREVKDLGFKLHDDMIKISTIEKHSLISEIEKKKYRCNISSIESYITMRHIMTQFNLIKGNGEFVIDSLCYLVLVIAFSVCLAMFGYTKGEESILAFIYLNYFLLFNTTFIIFAALNFYLLKNIKLIWSIIYDSSMDLLIVNKKNGGFNEKSSFTKYNNNNNNCTIDNNNWKCDRNFIELGIAIDSLVDVRDPIDLDHFIITPHMHLIWMKLIQSEQTTLVPLFTFDLLGIFGLNYSSVLKVNFWLGSIFMISSIYIH